MRQAKAEWRAPPVFENSGEEDLKTPQKKEARSKSSDEKWEILKHAIS